MKIFDKIFYDFKKDLSTRKTLLRFIKRTSRRKIILLILGTLVIGELAPITGQNYFYILFIVSLGYLFWVIIKELNNIRNKKYGTDEEFQIKRYDILLDILERNSIFDRNRIEWSFLKVNSLIEICNIKLTKPKISGKTLSIVGGLVTALIRLIPQIQIKKLFTNLPEELAVNIITLTIQSIGLLIMFSPLIFEIMDRKYNKIEELRNMLLELKLTRF